MIAPIKHSCQQHDGQDALYPGCRVYVPTPKYSPEGNWLAACTVCGAEQSVPPEQMR